MLLDHNHSDGQHMAKPTERILFTTNLLGLKCFLIYSNFSICSVKLCAV